MKFYSRFAKMTNLFLQVICIAGFTFSVFLAGYVLDSIGSIEDLTKVYQYHETTGCGELLGMKVAENIEYGRNKAIFETNGAYDPDKIIDIQNPFAMEAETEDDDYHYTVGAIRSMSEAGASQRISELLSMAYTDEMTGEIFFADDSGCYSDYSEEFWNEITGGQTTACGTTLAQVFEKQSDYYVWHYLESLYQTLDHMAIYLGGRNINMDTNLKFVIRNTKNGNVYTNVRAGDKIPDEAVQLVSFSRTDGTIQFDWQADDPCELYLQDYLRSWELLGDNEEGVIALDTSYPMQDEIKQERDIYESYQPYFKFLVAAAIICLVIWLICLVIATIQTGKTQRGEAVTLGRFDRIPTEFAAIIAVVLGSCALGIAVSIPYELGISTFLAICETVIVTIGSIIFMWAYLSLVRRIKTKTMWSNSLVKRILDVSKNIYHTRRRFEKTLLLFVGFALFHIVMVAVGGGFGIFLVLVCDVAIVLRMAAEIANGDQVREGILRLAEGDLDYEIDLTNLKGENLELAKQINTIGDGMQAAVDKAMKHERMKAELITNVSHDIKTPLTSIINYVDLLKRENLEDPKIRGYIDVLDRKSQRLKHLAEDLIEASKASTGNIELQMSRIHVQQILQQAYGEFDERLANRGLSTRLNFVEEPVIIWADGKQLWRIFENLLNNISKYAMPNTRVYIDLKLEGKYMVLSFKNMSEYALNINADELTERFIRGDESRSTEGSGLGLSIAKNLTELQGGLFEIYLDGDLFKVTLTFERQNVEKTLN